MTAARTWADVQRDPRVSRAYRDGDGYWAELAPGWTFEDCISIRSDTVADLCWQLNGAQRATEDDDQ